MRERQRDRGEREICKDKISDMNHYYVIQDHLDVICTMPDKSTQHCLLP
jgi:hypothetical protein